MQILTGGEQREDGGLGACVPPSLWPAGLALPGPQDSLQVSRHSGVQPRAGVIGWSSGGQPDGGGQDR